MPPTELTTTFNLVTFPLAPPGSHLLTMPPIQSPGNSKLQTRKTTQVLDSRSTLPSTAQDLSILSPNIGHTPRECHRIGGPSGNDASGNGWHVRSFRSDVNFFRESCSPVTPSRLHSREWRWGDWGDLGGCPHEMLELPDGSEGRADCQPIFSSKIVGNRGDLG